MRGPGTCPLDSSSSGFVPLHSAFGSPTHEFTGGMFAYIQDLLHSATKKEQGAHGIQHIGTFMATVRSFVSFEM